MSVRPGAFAVLRAGYIVIVITIAASSATFAAPKSVGLNSAMPLLAECTSRKASPTALSLILKTGESGRLMMSSRIGSQKVWQEARPVSVKTRVYIPGQGGPGSGPEGWCSLTIQENKKAPSNAIEVVTGTIRELKDVSALAQAKGLVQGTRISEQDGRLSCKLKQSFLSGFTECEVAIGGSSDDLGDELQPSSPGSENDGFHGGGGAGGV